MYRLLKLIQYENTPYNSFEKLEKIFYLNPLQIGSKNIEKFILKGNPEVTGTIAEFRDLFHIDSYYLELINGDIALIYYINESFHIKKFPRRKVIDIINKEGEIK